MKLKGENSQLLRIRLKHLLRKLFWLVFWASFCMYMVENFDPDWNKKNRDELVSAPLGFITLRATSVPAGVRLSWMDKAYEKNSYVEIEKSTDEQAFYPVKRIDETHHEPGFQSFTYTDSTYTSREITYRLKMVDEEGRPSHSLPIKYYPTNEAFDFSLSPNSRGNEIWVYIKRNKEAKVVDFAVWDLQGLLVFGKKKGIKAGKSDLKLKTGHLESGVYFVTTSEDGVGKSAFRKFIIP